MSHLSLKPICFIFRLDDLLEDEIGRAVFLKLLHSLRTDASHEDFPHPSRLLRINILDDRH